MASIITKLLRHLAMFLFLALLITDPALASKIKNHAALEPQPSSTYIVHANHLAKPPHFASLEHWYHSMVATHSPRAVVDHSSRILYTYDTVMHGFAVQLTGDEARRMSGAEGVTGVYEDRMLRPRTTRTPGFLGLDPGFGAWPDTDFGDGVIIGFVDSGIWPESPSFNDQGLGAVRSSWRGKCVDAGDFNASLCNNKLVGAKAFDAAAAIKGNGPPSPRDTDGHGTHVASTAAGSEVGDTGFLVFARGTARDMAPKAKVAMYKVTENKSSDVVAAIDAAVKDGVDVLSLSLGDDDPHPFYNDSLAVAVFDAERKGVFVVLAGGNTGPDASTVTNVAPWMTTVGAATVDRLFPAKLNLGDGAVVTGQSLYTLKSSSSIMTPLVFSACNDDDLTLDRIRGKILVCMDGEKGDHLQVRDRDAGAARPAGIVLVDSTGWLEGGVVGVGAQDFTAPILVLSLSAGEKLRSYAESALHPTAAFSFTCETAIGKNRARMVSSFSSRGPNPVTPHLLKPDVIAPGESILGAWKGDYIMESGTSMACPHVAGVAALTKKKYPSWTPAMVRSALVTSAGTLDNVDRAIQDNAVFEGSGGITAATPFAAGAGHVRHQLALDAGLVYDASERDYVDFLCALNYTAEQMRAFVPDFVRCTGTLAGGPAGLNYPSFVVVFDGRTDVRSLARMVTKCWDNHTNPAGGFPNTKVSEEAETYKVTVAAPDHVKVTVTPAILEFTEQYEKRSYTVEFRSEGARGNVKARWDFGHIIWENEKHEVRSPVAFLWTN